MGFEGSPSALFPYWSFTKTAIAICALRLADQGTVELDAPLPGWQFTLRQLLQHTAGLPDYYALPDYRRDVSQGKPPWAVDDLLERSLAQGMLFAPGEGWTYSNVGYLLARKHIEKRAGQSLAALVRRFISEPLALESLGLATTQADFEKLHWDEASLYHPGWVYHGCLTGTAEDAAGMLQGLMAGELLGRERLEEMLATHPVGGAIPGRPFTECGYGLGLMSGRAGAAGRMIGHSGGGPFAVNAVYHFPDRPVPVTVACFTAGPDEGVPEHAVARIALSF
ncbi:serine hydrolase domain-containing protein [Notoacmeibacter ruber]|uniref:serine hydrolase domain-containing protein n=1 Tax=Notoacmeibacter ruber TaxID=2670375 RepID=UPI0018F4973E|nr:serine hydrolase domain-containing protein [Notoacmeibacter ruber]